jgi:hypothetical protein
MGYGGLLAQATYDSGEADAALRSLMGQLLGFLLVVGFGVWMMRRSRANRAHRPPPSGWYADPWGGPTQRWWNGATWTGHVRPDPAAVAWYGAPGQLPHPVPQAPGAGHPGQSPPVGPPASGPPPEDADAGAPGGWPPPGDGRPPGV